jgi:hypothetical protein
VAETTQTDVNTVREFINRERAMRQAVFKHDRTKRETKIADADNALAALGRIETALCKAEDLRNSLQPGLFDSGEGAGQ